MAATIHVLPPEIRARIFGFLDHTSLVQLIRTNKALHEEAGPLIWTRVELHRPDYHEYYQYEDDFRFIGTPSGHVRRPYHALNLDSYYDADDYYRQDGSYCEKAFQLLKCLEESTKSAKSSTYAPMVRFLCMTFLFYHDDEIVEAPWSVFQLLANLEHLELSVHWPYDARQWDSALTLFTSRNHTPLSRLHTLHLRGYIPADFVRYLCNNTSKIKDLELALLDRPVGSVLCTNRKNPPPGSGEPSSDGNDSEIDSCSTGSTEDFDQEEIAPRALAALLDTTSITEFTSITYLTLVRPVESAMNESRDGFHETYVSQISERRILKEWEQLIRASRATLESLVLDQRPFAEMIETDCTSDVESLNTYPYGPGYRNFTEHVLPALLEEAEWPRLKSIRLYGFDTPTRIRERIEETLLHQVMIRFGPLGVDVKSGIGMRMLFESDDGVVRLGDGFGGDKLEE